MYHHTADHSEVQAENIEKSHAARGYSESSMGSHICYHFLIGKDGTVKQNRSLYERSGCTRNSVVNAEAIQVVFAGNFEIEDPTKEQLNAFASLYERLNDTYDFKEVIPHREASPSACAGKHLIEAISNMEVVYNKVKEREGDVWYITRYYSPVEGQKRYFHGSYLKDVEINCGLKPDGTAGDCLTTANGHRLEAHQAFKVAACPPEIPFGTKIDIEGIGTVTCHDRGGAIKEKRLDVWAGIGMDALADLKHYPAGYLNVTFQPAK